MNLSRWGHRRCHSLADEYVFELSFSMCLKAVMRVFQIFNERHECLAGASEQIRPAEVSCFSVFGSNLVDQPHAKE